MLLLVLHLSSRNRSSHFFPFPKGNCTLVQRHWMKWVCLYFEVSLMILSLLQDIATFSLFTNPREIKTPPKRTSFRQLAKASPEKVTPPNAVVYTIRQHTINQNDLLIQKLEADTPEPFSNARVWKASDELALLDALEQFGYGRWKDIQAVLSQSMNGITCEEIQEHYLVHYIFTNITKRPLHLMLAIQQIAAIFENYNNLTMQDQNALNDDNQPSVTKEELSRLRYYPKRDEFVVEYDNEAEAEMDHYIWKLQGDEAVRKEFILAILRVYNSRLKNRLRMKAAVRKYGLVEKFCEGGNALTEGSTDSNEREQLKVMEIKPKGRWPKISQTLNEKLDEQDFTRLFTPFELFADKQHLQSLYRGLKREMALKQCFRKFCQYKRHRLMDMEAIRQFEEDRYQKREKRKQSRANSILSLLRRICCFM